MNRHDEGIRARTARGSIGASWWSRRFIDVMESIADGGRLARGRTYARQGRVLDLDVAPYRVSARVRGSGPRPYRVTIAILPINEETWASIERTLAGQAIFRAQLLAGEMPPDIEDVFADHEAPLFPEDADDIAFDCSCPDWGDPCKHVAAALYLLAEAFDDDPFLVLAWNGRTREELMTALREGAPASSRAPGLFDVEDEPLADRLDTYWTTGTAALRDRPAAEPGPPDLMLGLFGDTPIKVRGEHLTDVLRPAYTAFSTGS